MGFFLLRKVNFQKVNAIKFYAENEMHINLQSNSPIWVIVPDKQAMSGKRVELPTSES